MSRTPSSTAATVVKSSPPSPFSALTKDSAASAGLSDGLANSMSAKGSMPDSRAIWPLVRRLGL
jgi:hypothetical protein